MSVIPWRRDRIDPADEATVFMQYGDYEGAKGVLADAIRREPNRMDLAKLMSRCEKAIVMEATTEPSIEQVKALNGRIFAMLSTDELNVYMFYRDRGRKYGVSITVTHELADPQELACATSKEQAEEFLRRTNARVFVSVHER